MNSHFKIFAVVCAMALLVPAGATAKRPEGKGEKGNKHGVLGKPEKAKGPKAPKPASANLKGVVTANDGTTMTITVDKASGHAKACKGESLSFDVSDARIHSADNEPDGDVDAMDVLVGHEVKVRTKVARVKGRKLTCNAAAEALVAKAVHNRSTPPVEDEVEVEEPEEVEAPEDVEGDEPEIEDPEGDETDDVEVPEEV